MIRRRHRASDEIMLIPFLDILCSLIGVLVLIIVVLCVAQTQRINGRTPEELERAQDFQKLKKHLTPKLAEREKLKTESTTKEERAAKLRKLLETSTADREKNKVASEKLMKELDDLLLELGGLKTQEPPLQKQIAELEAEIKKRQPPANRAPAVVVQPGGSGLAKGSKVFFVEASGGKLTFYWDEKTKGTVSANPDVIAADAPFNAFLKSVQGVPQSKIIFLLRDDGMYAFNLGAGWAQATFNYRVDQIGKLPLPGRGELDLRMFKDFLGTLPPPPTPAATPAPVPPKS
jgi:biopolymer transport protein ExbD